MKKNQRSLKDNIIDLCNDVIRNEKNSYYEYLQEHENGMGHIYSLACLVLAGINEESNAEFLDDLLKNTKELYDGEV